MTQIPADYNLPNDYTFAMNSWGNSFYKTYLQGLNYADAKAQCESDGAYLATPRSNAENSFIAGLIPDQTIWIGINDIDEEGSFVAADGLDVTFTKWYDRQPDNYNHNNGYDEDGATLTEREGFWNDKPVNWRYKFVCLYNIPSQVWHGESDIATITSNAGQYNEKYGVENMFDDDYSDDTQVLWAGTYWFSDSNHKFFPKPIVIEFAQAVQFHELTILKRLFHENVYSDVCLVLNNDVDNALCTDSPFGFEGVNDKDSRFITWRKLTDGVKRIDLVFGAHNSHAYIADLKIFYNKSDKRSIEILNGNKYEAILIENTKPDTLTWAGSKQLCEDFGFQLPVPDSDEMNNFLVNFAPQVYGEIHLGSLSDTSERNTEYNFINAYTNEQLTYSNWHRNEPNDGPNNNAVVGILWSMGMGSWHGSWYDFAPNSNRGVQYKGRPVHHICMKKLSMEHNPLLTWHGESDIATFENDGGVLEPYHGESWTYEEAKLFDDDTESIFVTSHDKKSVLKTLTITFNEEIQFEELLLMKWSLRDSHPYYNRICLELDDNTRDQLCTYKDDGSTDARSTYTINGVTTGAPNTSRYITLRRPTKDVKKIKVKLPINTNAQFADLKIRYYAKPKPSQFALSDDYKYYDSAWGKKFYKVYTDKMNWSSARAQCESDGAMLAIPSSAEENQFIADLGQGNQVWIGVTDIDEEGKYVGVDGSELTFTNWYKTQPDNYKHRPDLDEDGVHIIQVGDNWANSAGYWNDQEINHRKNQFVCSLTVKGKFYALTSNVRRFNSISIISDDQPLFFRKAEA